MEATRLFLVLNLFLLSCLFSGINAQFYGGPMLYGAGGYPPMPYAPGFGYGSGAGYGGGYGSGYGYGGYGGMPPMGYGSLNGFYGK
uniref:Uncharacterized protein n=2 Tax=Caenorhabditis japonica TaxID=281687 RepID=A0A8R1EW62_CAEJA